MELEKTSLQDWIFRRATAVRDVYTAFDCLNEHNITTIPDPSTPVQVSCPFPEHGIDARPSARYYPAIGGRSDYLRCYKCRSNWDSIALHAKFQGVKFMEALLDLERRFRIRVPRRPDAPEFKEPTERGSDYVSTEWADVSRVLALLETKLMKLRSKVAMNDFIKYCRVLDAVRWDFEHAQNQANPAMVLALQKVRTMMQATEEEADAVGGLQDMPEHG